MCSLDASAQATLVQHKMDATSASVTSHAITPTSATTAGNLLVFNIVNPGNSTDTYSLSSTGGTSETGIVHPSQCLKQQASPNGAVDCFYVLSAVGGTTQFTLSYTNSSPSKIELYEVNCPSCTLDGTPTTVLNTTTTTPNGASITTAGASAGFITSSLSGGPSANISSLNAGSFTSADIDNTDTFAFASAYILNPMAGSQTAQWTFDVTDVSFGNSIAFKSGGGGSPTRFRGILGGGGFFPGSN